MPRDTGSEKRGRQYEHAEGSERKHGRSMVVADETAARTLKKERVRCVGSRTTSETSADDNSSDRRGLLRSHRGTGQRSPRGGRQGRA
jgi:hypothetical protein